MGWIKNILLFSGSLVITLLCLEMTLRLFPVTEVISDQPLSSDGHPFDVSSTPNRAYDYSRLWNFQNSRTRWTHSQGFFSDFDYDESLDEIVVLGDSFVTALQVDFEDKFHQLIGHSLKERVYRFGVDGFPLSQYEAYLSDVCELDNPSKVVMAIITNDFDESHYSH